MRIKPGGRVGSGPRVEFMQSPGWRQAGERTCPGGGAEAQMQSTQHKQMNTCTRARRHAPTHARRHARRHAGRHAYMHTHSLSLTHTHTNKQTNTCTHTQAQIRRKTQRKHLRTIARALKDVLAHLRTTRHKPTRSRTEPYITKTVELRWRKRINTYCIWLRARETEIVRVKKEEKQEIKRKVRRKKVTH